MPSPRSARRASLVLVLALLVGLGACDSSRPEAVTSTTSAADRTSTTDAHRSATTTTGPSASSTLPPGGGSTKVPASDDELEALLVTSVPAGYIQQDDSVGDTGPSDLAKAIRDEGGGDDVRKALTAERFVRGYQRLWQTASGDQQIIVFLYQFADTTGARGGYDRWAGQMTSEMDGSTTFAPTGLPENASTGVSGTSQGTTGAVVLFTSGVFLVQIQVVDSGSEAQDRSIANSVAVDQLSRL